MNKNFLVITSLFFLIYFFINSFLELYKVIADTSYLPELIEDKSKINILSSYADLYSKTNEELSKIIEEINKTKEKLKNIQNQKVSLQREIEAFDTKIDLLEKQKKEVNLKIEEANQIINDLEQKIKEIEEKQFKYEKISNKLINIINKENMESITSLILKSDKLSDLVFNIRTSSILEQQMRKTILEILNSKKELIYSRQLLDIKQKENKNLLSKLEVIDKNLNNEKQAKIKLLELTKGDEQNYQNLLKQAIEEQEKIKQKLSSIEEDFAKKTAQSIKIPQNKNNIDYENLFEYNVYLDWPTDIRPIRFSAFFDDPWYVDLFGFKHDAIDIKIPQGSNVLAANDGYVFEAKDNDMGYSYIIIGHTNGIFTLYGHISEILVKPNDIVTKGQIIGKSGGMPGTKGAGPFTTGPHLHFEVHYAGQAQDPLMFLDLKDIYLEEIPDEIFDRYKTRVKQMIIKYPFVLIGNNESERREYLLNNYAHENFKDKNIWIETALKYNIDPDFLICIGFAETTLGNNMKSINNVGNVGNNDRGDILIFETPKDGIEAIAKTLSNNYLKNYTTIGELSRWGNKNGAIYASSNKYWFINVSKCMSAIKGGFVDEDFKFRLNN